MFIFHGRVLFASARAHPRTDGVGAAVQKVVVGAKPPSVALAARFFAAGVFLLPPVVRGVEVRERGSHLERRVHGREMQSALVHRRDAVPLAQGRLGGHERASIGAQVRRGFRVDVSRVRRLAFVPRELNLQLAALGLVAHGVHVLDVVRPVRGAQRVLKHAQRLVRRARAVEKHRDATHDAVFVRHVSRRRCRRRCRRRRGKGAFRSASGGSERGAGIGQTCARRRGTARAAAARGSAGRRDGDLGKSTAVAAVAPSRDRRRPPSAGRDGRERTGYLRPHREARPRPP